MATSLGGAAGGVQFPPSNADKVLCNVAGGHLAGAGKDSVVVVSVLPPALAVVVCRVDDGAKDESNDGHNGGDGAGEYKYRENGLGGAWLGCLRWSGFGG